MLLLINNFYPNLAYFLACVNHETIFIIHHKRSIVSIGEYTQGDIYIGCAIELPYHGQLMSAGAYFSSIIRNYVTYKYVMYH